jgi:hypothetical protein
LALLRINCCIDLRLAADRELDAIISPVLQREFESLAERFPDSSLADRTVCEELGRSKAPLIALTFLRAGYKCSQFLAWKECFEAMPDEAFTENCLTFRYLSDLSRSYLLDQHDFGGSKFGRWASRMQTRDGPNEGAWEPRGATADEARKVFATATMLYCMRMAPGRCTGW